jgi:hypothetical protein
MPGRLRLFRARGRAFPPERRAKRGARQQGVRAIDRRQHMTREARLFDEQPAVARDDVCDAIHQRGDQGREPPGLRHDIDIEQHDRLVGRVDAAQGCQLILALLRGRLRPAGEHDLAVEGAGPERRVRASKAGSASLSTAIRRRRAGSVCWFGGREQPLEIGDVAGDGQDHRGGRHPLRSGLLQLQGEDEGRQQGEEGNQEPPPTSPLRRKRPYLRCPRACMAPGSPRAPRRGPRAPPNNGSQSAPRGWGTTAPITNRGLEGSWPQRSCPKKALAGRSDGQATAAAPGPTRASTPRPRQPILAPAAGLARPAPAQGAGKHK